jgi:hypothetical protein
MSGSLPPEMDSLILGYTKPKMMMKVKYSLDLVAEGLHDGTERWANIAVLDCIVTIYTRIENVKFSSKKIEMELQTRPMVTNDLSFSGSNLVTERVRAYNELRERNFEHDSSNLIFIRNFSKVNELKNQYLLNCIENPECEKKFIVPI